MQGEKELILKYEFCFSAMEASLTGSSLVKIKMAGKPSETLRMEIVVKKTDDL